jgi:hypothetical protein
MDIDWILTARQVAKGSCFFFFFLLIALSMIQVEDNRRQTGSGAVGLEWNTVLFHRLQDSYARLERRWYGNNPCNPCNPCNPSNPCSFCWLEGSAYTQGRNDPIIIVYDPNMVI